MPLQIQLDFTFPGKTDDAVGMALGNVNANLNCRFFVCQVNPPPEVLC